MLPTAIPMTMAILLKCESRTVAKLQIAWIFNIFTIYLFI